MVASFRDHRVEIAELVEDREPERTVSGNACLTGRGPERVGLERLPSDLGGVHCAAAAGRTPYTRREADRTDQCQEEATGERGTPSRAASNLGRRPDHQGDLLARRGSAISAHWFSQSLTPDRVLQSRLAEGIPPRGRGSHPVFVSCLALLVGACSGGQGGERVCGGLRFDGPRSDTSLVLIVNDAMRPDRLGAYGGPARTPAFDAFARTNLRFDRAYAQSPWTKPSVATLFTSLYPSQHGALLHSEVQHANRNGEPLSDPVLRTDVLSAEQTTLAEVLRDAGFRTAAFVGNPWLERRFGFEQGFELYDDSFATWDVPGERLLMEGSGEAVVSLCSR